MMDGYITLTSNCNACNEEEELGTAMIAGRKYMIAIIEACTA